MKSIITTKTDRCYICGYTMGLDEHHCIYGKGVRSLADADHLIVPLCRHCHKRIHQPTGIYKDFADTLFRNAQLAWEQNYGTREQFIERYKHNYL